jgi:uncharacterized protein
MRQSRLLPAILAGFFIAPVLTPAQEVAVPHLSRYATDLTGTFSTSQLEILEKKLREFDTATSTQVAVLMIPTIGSWPLEEYTLKVAEENRIGRKGKDNGALVFVAKDDREVRIEVGYGLEGVLTDALSGIIIRREIIPRFREGDFFGGVNAGVEAVFLATRNEYKAEPDGDKGRDGFPVFPVFLFILIFLLNIIRRRGRGGRFTRSGWFPMGGSWGGGSGGGGGFGGGFSGGGGSFGGGGASGRW